ncbi:hypothetical protein JCM8547_001717 [Rhodosporidiobolus lusitaniae]
MSTQDPRPSYPSEAPHPGQLAQIVKTTVSNAISRELTPQDRIVLEDSEHELMKWARRGFFAGSLVGGAFAFRSRWTAGREAMRNGALPRLFFPTAKDGPGSIKTQLEVAKKAAAEDAKAGAKAAEDSMRAGKGRFFAKAFGFGILGSVLGTQVGVFYGRSRANKILENSGRQDAITAALERGLERAKVELEKVPGASQVVVGMRGPALGGVPVSERTRGGTNATERDSIDGVGYEEPGRELEHSGQAEGVGYSDRAPPQDQFPGSLADPTPPSSFPSSSSDSNSSRWDELRRSRAAPPSKWDELRQDRGRASVPPPTPSSAYAGEQMTEKQERDLISQRDSQEERERRRREFDALFEKEAKGGDDSMDDTAWKK